MPRIVLALLLGAATALLCGVPAAPADRRAPRGVLVERVLGEIERLYVVEQDIDALFEDGLDLMVRQLDPNTRYIPPSEVEEFEGETEGYYVGIGIVLGPLTGEYPTIQTVFRSGPAAAAGLAANDEIVRIERRDVRGLAIAELKALLQGPTDTVVVLTIRRAAEAPREIAVTRKHVKFSSITSVQIYEDPAWRHAIGYVRAAQFQESTGLDVRKACDNLRRAGAGALILDLRRNGGGLMDQGVEVARLFLRDGMILRTRARRSSEDKVYFAEEPGEFLNVPLAVLIDGGSASAAEFVAAALQDHGRALLIGEPSFGKWTTQIVLDLGARGGNGMLKLTTASFHRQNERRAVVGTDGKQHVHPHVLIETDEALADSLEAKWIDEQLARINDPLVVKRSRAPTYLESASAGTGTAAAHGADGVLIRALAILSQPEDYEKLLATPIPEIAAARRGDPREESEETLRARAETPARESERRP